MNPGSLHRFEGGCHCGNLGFVFEASAGLDALGLRADQCSFCRAHNARNTSDPNGGISIRVRDSSKLLRYRFGLKTADFLVCGACGVYIGAMMDEDGRRWMTVNVNAFRPPPPADFPMSPVNFDAEDVPARLARRKMKWTPVSEFA
jgi:hypothetical protein